MADFGRLWSERKVSLLNTRPSTIVEPVHNLPWDIVATDSTDGATVYVHKLIPPTAGKSIRLPAPKNGRRFSSAALLLGGGNVTIKQSSGSLDLEIPADVNWMRIRKSTSRRFCESWLSWDTRVLSDTNSYRLVILWKA